ncbi:LOW QUALITY PROTEIN: germinal-center associated nuclear protein [Electrophorus electricus]|uniref:LOW QUALITY PROTEIN: germinal-center associated nuclear protein n=1 Tax=Electrophorus electricus TaxID=8005 RepID=UPI0015D0B2B8|nr:LOW QUALITY PROTEIN: germinal-center associated nuclear protein [Electrophorus electricus]
MAQSPGFGQPALGQETLGFGTPSPSNRAEPDSCLWSGISIWVKTSVFGQPTSGFGLPSTNSQLATSSVSTGGTQPSFGQSSFGQPSAFSLPTATSGSVVSGQNNTQTLFSFKPPNEAVFKPIFSVSPEPPNPQPAPEPLGLPKPTASGSDSSAPGGSGVSLFTGVKPSTLGFSFSQPGSAPSVSATSGKISQTETLGGNGLQFTFSQPANPSSNCSSTSALQPSTVPSSSSSFSFLAKVLQPQTETKMPLFGGTGTAFGQPPFGFRGPKHGQSQAERLGDEESTGEPEFGSLGKGMKRKDEPVDPNSSQGKSSKIEEVQGGAEAPRHLSKRPLLRNRGPASGLFRNALSGLMKTSVRKEDRPLNWNEEDRPDPPVPDADVSATPPRAQVPIRNILEKAEKAAFKPEAERSTPARRARHGESTDSLASLSPSETTVIQCKGVPPHINNKGMIGKHFGRFGKVARIYCRLQKNVAIVHFHDHATAVKAKKRGKIIQGTEIQIFWQRKKQSPSEKAERAPEIKDVGVEGDSRPVGSQLTPLRKSLPRSPAVTSSISLPKGSPAKKPSVTTILQFDSEYQQEMALEGHSLDRPMISLPSSLQHLIGQEAETAEEKYRLLEQRDKILRQLRPKRTDLDMSKVFVGTCLDMCPEKERYMRETSQPLSIFELIPDTEKVDHYAAIKEYSRSSADQEEPLPHELRPLPVLSMTMDYLVTQIMDQGDGNYRDWYDFVWNRTRGIRKDITQQHLCDPITVSLIEKCTRFHIHCAHHLCQEPMISFDAKINNENMTKCLQSLKEMYQDLATKEVYCPHEAEFRQYSVLLKLNEGDILREVQQFHKEVRDSAEVKFAVQAFAALNSNNFVRFFKLVKAASYLASCILHRYFNQVRHTALKALNMAYTVGSQRSTTFPVEDLVRTLMFRNASEATDFLQQYGLSVTDGMAELSRTAYQEPDLPLPQRKSMAIERKRAVLIGEVVNGGALPNPPQHIPVCSFDSNNKYRGEGASFELPPAAIKVEVLPKPLSATDARSHLRPKLLVEPSLFAESPAVVEIPQPTETEQTGEPSQLVVPGLPLNPKLTFQPIAQPQPIRPTSPPPKLEPAYSNQDLMNELESVVEEVLQAEVADIAKAGAEYVSAALSVSETELETVVCEVVTQMLRDLSASEIAAERERIAEEKRKLEEARQRLEHEAFLDELSSDLCAEITEEVLTQCTRETADAEIKCALEEKAVYVAHCSEEVCNSLVEEALEQEIAHLARDLLAVELRRIHKFIKRWRDVVAVRRQLKRQMRGFPAAPCCVDPRFKLKAWAPSAPSPNSKDVLARGVVNLGNAGNMVVSCTSLLKTRNDSIRQMRVDFYFNLLLSERIWAPLDLPMLVAESTPNPPDRIFWKAALLLPSDQDDDMSFADSTLKHWLEVKLGGAVRREESAAKVEGSMQTLLISNSLRDTGLKTHRVHLCIKVSHGPLSEEGQSQLEEGKDLLGTSALLMLLPPLSSRGHPGLGEADGDVPLLSALLQLKQVQQASCWNTALPLVLLIPGQLEGQITEEKLEEVLMLKTLVNDGLISEYIFIHVAGNITDLQGSHQIGEAVRWLVAHSPASTVLSCQPLLQFVEAGLCREFHARFGHDKQERLQAGFPCQEPAAIIRLYNSVLAYLAGMVSSEQLASLSWPPPEFSLPENKELVPHLEWNSPQHLAWLKRAILSLQIPEWDRPPPNTSWPCLCAYIFQYVSQIPSSAQSQPLLMSRLEHLLARVLAQQQRLASDEEVDDEKDRPSFNHIPWDDILFLCIEHRLKDWNLPETPNAKDSFTDSGDIWVYYYKDQLKDFLPPESWVAAVKGTHMEKRQHADGFSSRSKVSSRLKTLTPAAQLPRQRLFQSQPEAEESPSVLDITRTLSTQELLPHHLLSSIQLEKAHNQRFEQQLERWLAQDPLDSVSMPLFIPSTLLSVPEFLAPSRRPIVSAASLKQGIETDDPAEKVPATCRKHAPLSLTQRLEELERLILINQEEEMACSLKINSLLEIIED